MPNEKGMEWKGCWKYVSPHARFWLQCIQCNC